MILRFDYEKTPEHLREMAACAEKVKTEQGWHTATLDSHPSLQAFYTPYMSCSIGKEFVRAVQSLALGPPLRILDVGAGRGETSLYLADRHHRVFPVDPSFEFCQVIEHMANRFGRDLTIYNSSAEHLDVAGEQFDAVIFNVSLHHCDDPYKALRNAYRFLRPQGTLLLIGEPMLPFFKTHASVQHDQLTRPEELGDYGGNEHSYRYAEYIAMMKQAGFRELRSEVVARYRSREVVAQAMEIDHRPPGLRRKIKSTYLHLVYMLQRPLLKPLLMAMERLSLVQLTFSAMK